MAESAPTKIQQGGHDLYCFDIQAQKMVSTCSLIKHPPQKKNGPIVVLTLNIGQGRHYPPVLRN